MDLQNALRIVRRNYGLVLVCVILVTGVAYLSSARQEKMYSATAVLLFHDPGYADILFNSNATTQATNPVEASATNLDLVSLQQVATRTARAIGAGVTANGVSSRLAINPQGSSDTVSLVATAHDPQFAARLATTYARQFIAFRRDSARSQLTSAQQVVKRQLASLPASERNSALSGRLQDRANELQVLAALQTGNAELVQPAATPTSASSPRPTRTAAIGLLVGVLLSILVVFLRERLDRRLRDVDEVERLFERPVLGSIPQSSAFRTEGPSSTLPAREREAFMLLSTSLRYFDVSRPLETVLVTSASPGDGKTTIGRNLAAATALAGQRALLIEADLRRPTLRAALDLQETRGLSDVLAGHLPWHKALASVPVGSGDRTDTVSFDVLPAGIVPPNPTDLISSDRMRSILEDAAKEYRLVVIDTPPTSVVSDAIPLLSRVDGVVVAVRLGRTTRDAARHLKRQLEALGAPLLGLVINSITPTTGYGGYNYGYPYLDSAENGAAGTNGSPEPAPANGSFASAHSGDIPPER